MNNIFNQKIIDTHHHLWDPSTNKYDWLVAPGHEIFNHVYLLKNFLSDIGNLNIKHYDLFRLTDNKELENIGLLENYNEHITLIEWPEKVKMVIDNKISLFFEYGHDLEKRTINIKGLSEKKLNDIK